MICLGQLAPGHKDRVIIREIDSEGKRVKGTQLVHYIIGLSKFCELRPSNIKLFDHIPQCMCVLLPRKCPAVITCLEGTCRIVH